MLLYDFFVWLGATPIGAYLNQSTTAFAYSRAQMVERRIPGMAVAVIRHGKVEKIGTYGQASLEFDSPVESSTPFSVASISKCFTAVAIMTLVETGKLRLDDAIASHFMLLGLLIETLSGQSYEQFLAERLSIQVARRCIRRRQNDRQAACDDIHEVSIRERPARRAGPRRGAKMPKCRRCPIRPAD